MSSDEEVEESWPKKKQRQRKEPEPPEDLSWVDRQDTPPVRELAEGEPEADTLAWHEWNLRTFFLSSALLYHWLSHSLAQVKDSKWKADVYKHFDLVTVEYVDKKGTFY